MEILKIVPYLENGSLQTENKHNFDPLRVEKSVFASSGTFANDKVPCPKMAILKISQYRKNKLNFDSFGVESEYMCNFANNLCASSSLLCQNWHADLEFACKFCFLVSKGVASNILHGHVSSLVALIKIMSGYWAHIAFPTFRILSGIFRADSREGVYNGLFQNPYFRESVCKRHFKT